jgi:ribosomal protein L3 glutamine methyltransferase
MSLSLWQADEVVTLGDAIATAANYLDQFDLVYGHGTASSMDDAAWLILEAMNLSPIEEPNYSLALSAEDKLCAEKFICLRTEKKLPTAYIVGRAWFAGLEFSVDERALIPRSPLAEPIMQGFCDYLDPSGVGHVLDLCTGGGCIAIACAYAFADARIDALDISDDALALAKTNVERHALQARVRLIQSDVFEALDKGQRYDLIISNPPYVDQFDMRQLGDEFKTEPALGLASGDDGLDITRQILKEAAHFLSPAGLLVCEVGNSAPALEAAFPNCPFLWLEFTHGGGGVFMLTKEELNASDFG